MKTRYLFVLFVLVILAGCTTTKVVNYADKTTDTNLSDNELDADISSIDQLDSDLNMSDLDSLGSDIDQIATE